MKKSATHWLNHSMGWKHSPERSQYGRGTKGFTKEHGILATNFAATFHSIEESGRLLKTTDMQPGALKDTLLPVMLSIAPSNSVPACEKGHLATIMYSFWGIRQVILFDSMQLVAHVKQQGPTTSDTIVADLRKFLRKFNGNELKKYHEGDSMVFYTTIGPGDALMIPPAFHFYDKNGTADVIGLKMCFLSSDHQSSLEQIDKIYPSSNPNELLTKSLDALVLAKAA